MNQSRPRLLALALCLFAAFAGAQTTASTVAVASAATTAAATANLLDLNTATPAQLKALKGIGDAYSKRIIDGRPYTAKNQIVTRGVVPQATYDAIKDQIVARAAKK